MNKIQTWMTKLVLQFAILLASMGLTSGTLIGQVKAAELTISWKPDAEPLIRKVAERTMRVHQKPAAFDWGEGVLMAGMMQAGEALNEPRYIDYVRQWADYWHQKGIEPVLDKIGYCGRWGPGLPLMMLYEKTKDQRYLEMAERIIQFMETKTTRTSDGGLGHWRDNKQLWVDTLYMACPVYARYGKVTANSDLVKEGSRQLAITARHSQDSQTGLFYHVYDDVKKQNIGVFWGRGNGWVIMSYVEILKKLDPESAPYKARFREFSRLMEGLLATQDSSTGMWRTVINNNDAYLETSASAMNLYAILDAHQAGILKMKDPKMMQQAWQSLGEQVDESGAVGGVSAGTGATAESTYLGIEQGTYHWGTGAWLLAASKLYEMKDDLSALSTRH